MLSTEYEFGPLTVLTFCHGRRLQIQNTFVKITGALHIGDRVTAKCEFGDFHDLLWFQSLQLLHGRPKANSPQSLLQDQASPSDQVAHTLTGKTQWTAYTSYCASLGWQRAQNATGP